MPRRFAAFMPSLVRSAMSDPASGVGDIHEMDEGWLNVELTVGQAIRTVSLSAVGRACRAMEVASWTGTAS